MIMNASTPHIDLTFALWFGQVICLLCSNQTFVLLDFKSSLRCKYWAERGTVGSRISGTRILGEFWIFLNFFFANHPRIHPWVNSRKKKIGHARSTPPMGGDRWVMLRLSKWSLKLGSSGFLWESFYDLQNYSDYFLSTPALPRPQGRQWVGLGLRYLCGLWS